MKKLTLGRMIVALVMILFCCMVGIALTGCRGGLFGGRQSPDAGKGDIKVYEIHFASNANSIANIGNAGTQSPMYQAPEGDVETAPAAGGTGAYVTTPTMPASGAQNAGTLAAKYGMQVINDGNKRSAETDTSAAAQLVAGNTQTQAGMNPATTQRQGTSNAGGSVTGTNEANPTRQTTVPVNLSGTGTAAQTPTATIAGAGSQPGAVSGGTTDATEATAPTTLTDTIPTAEAGTTGVETVRKVVANADGTLTVTTDQGTHTGKLLSQPSAAGKPYVFMRSDNVPVTMTATGDLANQLCAGCGETQ